MDVTLKLRNSCDACQTAKLKCSQEKPSCQRCIRNSWTCVYSPLRRTGRPRKHSTPLQARENTTPAEHGRSSSASSTQKGELATTSTPLTPNFLSPSSSGDLVTTDASSSNNVLAMTINDSGSRLEREVAYTQGISNHDNVNTVSTMSTSFLNSNSLIHGLDDFLTDDGSSLLFTSPIGDFEGLLERSVPSPLIDSLPNTSIPSPLLTDIPSNYSDVDWQLFNNFSAQSNTCNSNCYSQLNQLLTHLNNSLSMQTDMAIDLVLTLERDMHILSHNILNCTACLGNPSTLVLLSAVAEQVIRMLEKAFISTTTSTQNTASSLSSKSNSSSSLAYSVCNRSIRESSHFCSFLQAECSLFVGNYELDEEIKTRFIKQLLKFRMGRLAAMLMEVRHALNAQHKDINANVAEEMFKDIGQRLEILRGMAELL